MARKTGKEAAGKKVEKAAVKAKHSTVSKFRDERKREALDEQLKSMQHQRAAPVQEKQTIQEKNIKTRSQTARDMDKAMEVLDLLK